MESIIKKLKSKTLRLWKKDASEVSDIYFKECDLYLQTLDTKACEKILFKYGFSKALDEYRDNFGLEQLENLEPIRRLRCLIHNIIFSNTSTEDIK